LLWHKCLTCSFLWLRFHTFLDFENVAISTEIYTQFLISEQPPVTSLQTKLRKTGSEAI
jgi:hypothetical protein